MANTENKFNVAKQNIEVELVRRDIKLLQQLLRARSEAEWENAYDQLHEFTQQFIDDGFEPDDLIGRFKKAIKLNKFRPQNLSLFMLAVRDDLNYIGGKFNTFNRRMGKLAQDIDANADKIREMFENVTLNRRDFATQFAHDWIRRIGKHPELVNAVRTRRDAKQLAAYNELFSTLIDDFCAEYKIARRQIDIRVVKNWAESDIPPTNPDKMYAFTAHSWGISVPNSLGEEEKNKILSEFQKSPSTYPGAFKTEFIRMNFSLIRNNAKRENINTFILMCANFAHEMNHVLDRLIPRKGALGPQISQLDLKTYTNIAQDEIAYHQSAQELSAYAVTDEMVKQLKKLSR